MNYRAQELFLTEPLNEPLTALFTHFNYFLNVFFSGSVHSSKIENKHYENKHYLKK